MVSRRIFLFAAATFLPLPIIAQQSPVPGPAQEDGPALTSGSVHAVTAPADRAAMVQLIERARSASIRTGGQAYDLKTSFTVNSDGQTDYDGDWQMEEVYDPNLGVRWTASLPGSYSITRISSHGALYGEETGYYVPLRLHEVRAALFDALPPKQYVSRASLRTADTVVDGRQLTCALLSVGRRPQDANPQRHWGETEDCIEPESGLLRIHSSVPGRYYEYDYSEPLQIGNRTIPRVITVHEAGRVVTTISVNSVTELTGADPALFVPTDAMKAKGRPIHLGAAETLFRVSRVSGATPGAVCVFGVVNASGQLMEAHSLQPANPNSQAALDAAHHMNFSRKPARGGNPEQHFVFVIRNFVPSP